MAKMLDFQEGWERYWKRMAPGLEWSRQLALIEARAKARRDRLDAEQDRAFQAKNALEPQGGVG